MKDKINEISKYLYENKNTFAVSVEELAYEFVELYPYYLESKEYDTEIDYLYANLGTKEFDKAFESCLAKYDKSTLVNYRISEYFKDVTDNRKEMEDRLINALPPIYKKVNNRNFQLYSAITFLEEGGLPPVKAELLKQKFDDIFSKTQQYIVDGNPQYVSENESMRKVCGGNFSYKREIYKDDYLDRQFGNFFQMDGDYIRYPKEKEIYRRRLPEKESPRFLVVLAVFCLFIILTSNMHKNPILTTGSIVTLIGSVYYKVRDNISIAIVGILIIIAGMLSW